MGSNGLPKVFQDDESEIPSASKWNDNFSFLNFPHRTLIRNGDFENFTGSLPDNWTLNGAGAASAESSDAKHGAKSVQISFGSADSFLKQSSPEVDFYKGRKVKAWCFVKTQIVGGVRLKITDGIGSSESVFHSGSDAYELLVVEHTVAGTATDLALELHVEGAGNALFDVAVLVDFDEARGLLEHPADVAAGAIGTPTREIFYKAPERNATIGEYRGNNVASNGTLRISFYVPHDFTSIVSAVLVVIPNANGGPQNVDFFSDYAAAGEDATAAGESALTNSLSYVSNQMTEFDISSVLTGIAAGDYVGFRFTRNGGGQPTLLTMGIRFRYS